MTSQGKIAKGQAKELNNHHFTVSINQSINNLYLRVYVFSLKRLIGDTKKKENNNNNAMKMKIIIRYNFKIIKTIKLHINI